MISRRPNLSPTASKSGPVLPPLPSTLWQREQAVLCTSKKMTCPRAASPSRIIAWLRYSSLLAGADAARAMNNGARKTKQTAQVVARYVRRFGFVPIFLVEEISTALVAGSVGRVNRGGGHLACRRAG